MGDGLRAVLDAADTHLLLTYLTAIEVEDGDDSREGIMCACRMVDNLDAVGESIILDVQRFACLLAAKVGSRGIEVVVVGLPNHRGPTGMAHP